MDMRRESEEINNKYRNWRADEKKIHEKNRGRVWKSTDSRWSKEKRNKVDGDGKSASKIEKGGLIVNCREEMRKIIINKNKLKKLEQWCLYR